MTSNGKIDRKRLPAPAALRSERQVGDVDARVTAYVAPDGDAEELVAALFEEVLFPASGSGRVGALDDFGEGGGRRSSVQFVGKLEASTGLRLQMRRLSEAPTPRSVAAALCSLGYDATGADSDGTDLPRLTRGWSRRVGRVKGGHVPRRPARRTRNALTVIHPGSLPHASMDTVGGVTRVDEMFFQTRDGTVLSARLRHLRRLPLRGRRGARGD